MSPLLVHLCFACALALVAWTVSRSGTRPALAHALWLLVLVKLLIPPVVEVPLLTGKSFAELPEASGVSGPAPVTASVSERSEAAPSPTVPTSDAGGDRVERDAPVEREARAAAVDWPLVPAWIAGACVMLLIAFGRARRFARLLRSAAPADVKLRMRVASLAARLRCRSVPEVVVVQGPVSPHLWCFFGRARLVWPVELDALDPAARDALLLHELAHWRRRDHLVRHLELIAVAVWWWCPLAWWSARRLRESEELAVDAKVVEVLRDRRPYAEGLLGVLDHLAGAALVRPIAAAAVSSGRTLERRLRMIMRGRISGELGRRGRVAMVALALLVPALPVAMQEEPASDVVAIVNGDEVTKRALQDFLIDRTLDTTLQAAVHARIADLELAARGLKLPKEAISKEAARLAKTSIVPPDMAKARAHALRGMARAQVAWRHIFADEQGVDPEAEPERINKMLMQFVMRKVVNGYELRFEGEDPAPAPGRLVEILDPETNRTVGVNRADALSFLGGLLTTDGLAQALDQLVDTTILAQVMKSQRVEVTEEEVDTWARNQQAKHPPPFTWEQICKIKGTSVGEERERWRRVQAFKRIAGEPAPEQRAAFLEKYRGHFCGSFRKISHILVADETTARAVKRKLDEGADFAELARTYSADTSTAPRGGRCDQPVKELDSPFETGLVRATYALAEEGDVSDPVRGRRGWHVIRLEQIQQGRRGIDFDDPRYADWITESHETHKMRKFLKELRKKAVVKRLPADRLRLW